MHVLADDLVGVYNINSTGALAYRHSYGNPDARVLTYTTDRPIRIDEEVTFDALVFPDIFAVAAYTVNGRSSWYF